MNAVRFLFHFTATITVDTLCLTEWQILNAFIKCVLKTNENPNKNKMATFDDSALHCITITIFRTYAIIRNIVM